MKKVSFQILKHIWVLLLCYLIVLPIFIIKVPYEITAPGDFSSVSSVLEIDGKKNCNQFYTTSVYVIDYATPFQVLMASLSKEAEVEKISTSYSHLTNQDYYNQGVLSKVQSITDSVIAAYSEANKIDNTITLSYSFLGYMVFYTESNLKDLAIGDIIIGTKLQEDEEYNSSSSMLEAIYKKSFYCKLLRYNGAYLSDTEFYTNRKEIEVYIDRSNENTGFSVFRAEQIDSQSAHPKYTYNGTSTGGNSGGLLQTLSLYYTLLGEGLPKNINIAGTGTISNVYDVEGNYVSSTVGAIGGIVQKIYTAYHSKDKRIFFCPTGESGTGSYQNGLEATLTYQKLKNPKFDLVLVSDFSSCIEYLEANL